MAVTSITTTSTLMITTGTHAGCNNLHRFPVPCQVFVMYQKRGAHNSCIVKVTSLKANRLTHVNYESDDIPKENSGMAQNTVLCPE